MFVVLFLRLISSQLYTYYISNDKVEGANGSYEKPLFFNWDTIITNIKRIGGGNDFVLIFKEGDYFPSNTNYGITFTDKNSGSFGSLTIKAEEGKRVRIITANKLTNWTRSSISDKFWIHDYAEDSTGRFLIVNSKSSTLCRAPSARKYARTIDYSVETDPNDSDYYIRTFEVQKDAIDMLKLTTTNEFLNDNGEEDTMKYLNNTKFVDYHFWTFSREKIISVDWEKNLIKTRVKISEDKSFGIGKVRKGDIYHIENLLPALNTPGEYFVFPNNSILYYPREDEDFSKFLKIQSNGNNNDVVEVFISNGGIALHSTNRENITIENLELIGSRNSGIYFTSITDLLIKNVTSHFCETGMYIANSNNVTVEHCFVENVGGYGMNLRKNNYQLITNNIVRGYGKKSYNCHGMWFYESCNNTIISNNDIGDGYHSPIQIFHKYSKDNETFNDILVKDNHVHHAGYGVLDDMGGVTALFVSIGTVIDHNFAHDIYSPNYCGGCFLTGSGSFGIVLKNNLAFNSSHNALKFDHGAEISLFNNIMGYNCEESVLTFTSINAGYRQWKIYNNIFIFKSTIMMGAFDKSDAVNDIDYNLYWHPLGPENINFRKKTWDYWQNTRGFDGNSYIDVDPLFVSPDNVDYNFINDSAYKKINFVPFTYDFGVIGKNGDIDDNEWVEKSKNYEFVSLYDIPDFWQFEGGEVETFDHIDENNDKNWTEIWTKKTLSDSTKVFITTDDDKCPNTQINNQNNNYININASNGDKCLKFVASEDQSDDNLRPKITIPVDWYEGYAEISFDLYQSEAAQTYIYFGDASNLDLIEGQLNFNKKKYQTFPAKKWFHVKVNLNFGSVKNDTKFDVEIDGVKQAIYFRTSFSKTSEIRFAVSKSNESTYIDNLYLNIDRKHTKFFEEELKNTQKITSIFDDNDSNNEINTKPNEDDSGNNNASTLKDEDPANSNGSLDNNKDKISPGIVAVIVIVVIVIIAAVIGGTIFFLRKKQSEKSKNDDLEL